MRELLAFLVAAGVAGRGPTLLAAWAAAASALVDSAAVAALEASGVAAAAVLAGVTGASVGTTVKGRGAVADQAPGKTQLRSPIFKSATARL